MKIYLLGMYSNPTTKKMLSIKEVDFAFFSVLGTWSSIKNPCSFCNWHWQEITEPLLIEWEPGSNKTGDFSWDGPFGFTFAAKTKVINFFNKVTKNIDFMEVVYTKTRNSEAVDLECKEHELRWAFCTKKIELNRKKSEVKEICHCEICGNKKFTFKKTNIVISKNEYKEDEIFKIQSNGRSQATFVTERLKEMILNEGFTNVNFSEAGYIDI